ncbi:AfsR/SARP family transcriptional regulator [Streptomyces hyaluromycini]|uniref:AfsR/SARP family transcriptional regulator n=1 Tax=Streptomyces hyaluromycini TaxID=1377993 RepID=UPI001237FDBD|nr:BTAD domain-containing putative transcriptional regulator [Streptomyces hyaluromycini]
MASSVVPERTMTKRGHLKLFDGFRLEIGDDRIHLADSAQRLLAYLTIQGPSPRTVVAGSLWGEAPEERALGSLRTTVWRINQVVPGLVTGEHREVALASFVSADVTEFAHRVTARSTDSGTRGHDLPNLRIRELLPGWYEDWVVFERDRLRQLHLHALEAAATALCMGGEYAAALDTALAAVRGDPLRESARRAVILVHLAEGNLVEAHREYQRFRALLAGELGVEPSGRLTSLVTGRNGDRQYGAPAPTVSVPLFDRPEGGEYSSVGQGPVR